MTLSFTHPHFVLILQFYHSGNFFAFIIFGIGKIRKRRTICRFCNSFTLLEKKKPNSFYPITSNKINPFNLTNYDNLSHQINVYLTCCGIFLRKKYVNESFTRQIKNTFGGILLYIFLMNAQRHGRCI